MKTRIILNVVLSSLLLYSCSALENQGLRNNGSGKAGIVRIPQFEKGENGTFLWSHYDATKRGSVMYVKNGKIRVLAENSPDAAFQSMAEIAAKTDVNGKVNAELAVKTQRTIAELGKRTAAVNMLRDALYRLNEMYYATAEEEQENRNIYLENLKLLNKFSSSPNKLENDRLLNLFNSNINSLNEKLLYKNHVDSTKTNMEDSRSDIINTNFLFKRIIDNAKDIAIAESDADKITITAESNASIKKSEENIKKMDLLNTLLSKMEDKLKKEEVEKFIKENLNN